MSFLADCQGKITEIQRRLSKTGESFISRAQRWRRISTVPSTDCDVVLTFGYGTNEVDIHWFLGLLRDRVPELICHLHNHRTSGQWALYLTAGYRDLLLGAEELRIKKPLATEHGGGLREFLLEELDLFANGSDERCFLSSSERSSIVHHYLLGLCARDGDCWGNTITFRSGQPLIQPLVSVGFIQQIFPVHETNELRRLRSRWVQGLSFRQPLDDVRRYFGVHIALYFAWLGHYTSALIFPAIVGLLVWIFVDTKSCKFYHLIMAVLCLAWSTMYLEHWKRTSSTLTYQWGEWDTTLALLEEPRTAFKGKLMPCPITGRLIRTYPAWRRNLIMVFLSAPVVLVSLVAVVGVTFGFVHFQDQMDMIASAGSNGHSAFGMFLSLVPKILLAITILVMDMAYRQLATWLTDLENHRLETEYHNHFAGKLLLLQFMNAFYSPFYTAFYLQDLDMLQQQLTTLLITRQIIGNAREVFLPYGQTRFRQFLLSFQYERYKKTHTPTPSAPHEDCILIADSDESVSNADTEIRHRHQRHPSSPTGTKSNDESPISPQEREAALLPYSGLDEDFLEIFIQFGYVSMFSCIFPVAGALAFLNNLVEIRGDAFKLTSSYQRPFARPASNIGIWQLAMTSMGYISVIVNIALLSVSGAIYELLPQMSTAQSILLLVVVEHCIYVLYYTLSSLIPDTPSSVMQQLAVLEHRRREALRTLERESMREYKRQRSSSKSQQDNGLEEDKPTE